MSVSPRLLYSLQITFRMPAHQREVLHAAHVVVAVVKRTALLSGGIRERDELGLDLLT